MKEKKKDEEEIRGKVISYYRSKLFPWNFILEEVAEEALEYYVDIAREYLHPACVYKDKRAKDVDVRSYVVELIRKEIERIVNDYLIGLKLRKMRRLKLKPLHGIFSDDYPFALSQCVFFIMLDNFSLRLEDVIDVNAISELIGKGVESIKNRGAFILSMLKAGEKKESKKFFGKRNLLDKRMRVISANGNYIGTVRDIIFDEEMGNLISLKTDAPAGEYENIPIKSIRLNLYNGSIIYEG